MTGTRLEKGDIAPAFTLSDQDGSPVSLADFAGTKTIVYFYPPHPPPAARRRPATSATTSTL